MECKTQHMTHPEEHGTSHCQVRLQKVQTSGMSFTSSVGQLHVWVADVDEESIAPYTIRMRHFKSLAATARPGTAKWPSWTSDVVTPAWTRTGSRHHLLGVLHHCSSRLKKRHLIYAVLCKQMDELTYIAATTSQI
jgi:hypothetical protein